MTKPYILLGATTNGSINVLQLLLKLYSLVHFWIPRFTFCKNHWDVSWSGSSNEINPNGWSTFKCSLHYKELQNPIPYLGNGMILTSHFVCFWELFFLLWYFFLFCCSSKAWIGLLTSSINACMQLIFIFSFLKFKCEDFTLIDGLPSRRTNEFDIFLVWFSFKELVSADFETH